MSYIEFKKEKEFRITRKSVQFRFVRISDYEVLIEVAIETFLSEKFAYISNVLTESEAYAAYENILQSGFE